MLRVCFFIWGDLSGVLDSSSDLSFSLSVPLSLFDSCLCLFDFLTILTWLQSSLPSCLCLMTLTVCLCFLLSDFLIVFGVDLLGEWLGVFLREDSLLLCAVRHFSPLFRSTCLTWVELFGLPRSLTAIGW